MKALGYTHVLADNQLPLDVWAGGIAGRYGKDAPPRCERCGMQVLLFGQVVMLGGQIRENQVEETGCCQRQLKIDQQDGVRYRIWTFLKIAR